VRDDLGPVAVAATGSRSAEAVRDGSVPAAPEANAAGAARDDPRPGRGRRGPVTRVLSQDRGPHRSPIRWIHPVDTTAGWARSASGVVVVLPAGAAVGSAVVGIVGVVVGVVG
jgi:hypothetical protein